jgi:hypothetical protein
MKFSEEEKPFGWKIGVKAERRRGHIQKKTALPRSYSYDGLRACPGISPG